jgi:hypothetical protein
MKAVIKISKRASGIVQEHLQWNRSIITFSNSKDSIWKGTKRFAH